VAWAVLAYNGLPWLRSGGEMIHEVGCSRQQRGMENSTESEALTSEGCWGGQSSGVAAAPSSFRCYSTRKKGVGGKG
jgi:hypothetical protein